MNWLGGAKKRLRLMGASINNMDVPNYKRKNVKLSEGFQNGVLQLPLNNNIEDPIFNKFYHKEQLMPQYLQSKEEERLAKMMVESEPSPQPHVSSGSRVGYFTKELRKREGPPSTPIGPSIISVKSPNSSGSGLMRRSTILTREGNAVDKSPVYQEIQSRKEESRTEPFKFRKRADTKAVLSSEPAKLRSSIKTTVLNTDSKMYKMKRVEGIYDMDVIEVTKESSKGQRKKVEFVTPKKKIDSA